MSRLLLAAMIILGPAAAGSATAQAPPPARVAARTDTYFGETVTDPYRWMETVDPELVA